MPNDIAADVEGDLVFEGGGLKISTDINRDRNLIVTRLMTIQGEIPTQPSLGVPARFIGGPVDFNSKLSLEAAVREALAVDGALIPAKPTIKALILGYDKMAVLVQSNRQYKESVEDAKLVVTGDYYTMSQMPITKLDGSEG